MDIRLVTKKRCTAGRSNTTRWNLFENENWIGDLVHFPEGWEFQPEDGDAKIITGNSEAEVLVKAALKVQNKLK